MAVSAPGARAAVLPARAGTRAKTRLQDLYALRPRAIWRAFRTDTFAFWMSCAYLFFEYVRPQAIWSAFDAYPYWARTFVLLALIGWALDSKRTLVWTWITTGVFAYLALIFISSQTAYWPEASRAQFMTYFNWVVIFFVLTNTTTTRQRVFILLLIFFLASFKLSLYGARTMALRGFGYADWGLRGPRGFFQNPGELAIQMVVFAPMALYFLLGLKRWLKRWQVLVLAAMPITAALTVLGTNTRGGQIALAAQILALVMVSRHRVKALVGVALIAAIGYQLLPEEQKARFETMGDDGTSQQRIFYLKHGWQMMKEHPILGVGYFNFIPYYNAHHYEDLINRDRAELPHNIFIQVGTDTGFTGLAVFLLLILGGFLSMRKLRIVAERRGDVFFAQMARGMNLALLGYVVAGQFVTVAYYPYLWIHLALCVAMAQAQHVEGRRGAPEAMAARLEFRSPLVGSIRT